MEPVRLDLNPRCAICYSLYGLVTCILCPTVSSFIYLGVKIVPVLWDSYVT